MKTSSLKIGHWVLGVMALSTSAVLSQAVIEVPEPVATKPPPPETSAKIQKQADEILKETSVVRGLKVLHSVPCAIQSRAGVEDMLQTEMKKQLGKDTLKATDIYLQRLKLVPANFDLKKYYLKMMDEQLAGYYDAKVKKFYTTTRVDSRQLETIMSHELTHALQDQHFDLKRLEKFPAHESDGKIALSALAEGDATLTMVQYTARSPLRALNMIASTVMPESKSSDILISGPAVLREGLTFPYMQGMAFVSHLHRSGGWPAVNRAYKQLPASTEQIMHPEKYLAREAPIKVPLHNLSNRLGAGWKLLDHDVNGEFSFYLILNEHLKDQQAATNGSAGWAGDRYAVYGGPHNTALIAQVTLWDSIADAREFADTYAQSVQQRENIQAKPKAQTWQWKLKKGGVWMRLQGKRVVILEGDFNQKNAASLAAPLMK